MALAKGRRKNFTLYGNVKDVIFETDLDASYPTGGYPQLKALAGSFGIKKILFASVSPMGGYQFAVDYTKSNLLVYQGDNTNAAAAPAIQVPNATDLSAVKNVRIHLVGQ